MKATVSMCAVMAVLGAAAVVTGVAQAPAPTPAKPPAAAQPATAKPRVAPATMTASPVVFLHVRVLAKDVEAAKKFWVGGLGGTPIKAGGAEAIKFPNTLVLLQKGEPKEGSKGSVMDHLTFEVKDLKPLVEALKKAGFMMATRAEVNSVYVVTDDIAFMPDQATSSAVVMGPDGVKVELRENKQATAAVTLRSAHFAAPNVAQMKDWYVKGLGARIGNRGFGFESLDIGKQPGLLMFTLANDKVAATDGRAADRIGFEVRGAALLAKKLEKQGAKITRPYGKSPETGAMSVVLTDPWGTTIELSEGLKL